MNRTIRQRLCLVLMGLGFLGLIAGSLPLRAQPDASGTGVILTLNGAVTPTSADYLSREIDNANAAGADLVIIEIDTPGGLVTSMQSIVKAILASDAPVATYVSPQGSRSASAGLYIMYSAHISAMAPATNTGAATPIELGGGGGRDNPFEDLRDNQGDESGDQPPETQDAADPAETGDAASEDTDPTILDEPAAEEEIEQIAPLGNNDAMRAKVINDSVAYIRSLAERRGRNADWAESAVREAVSVTANEALELNVIDIVAEDLDDLLAQIDGMTVTTAAGEVTLSTENMQLNRVEPQMWEIILGFFADPNVAAILLSLGTLGITAEIWNPGSIFPGAFGVICLLLAFYSFQVLPYEGLGVGLMVVGLILIGLEAYTPTFGISGVAGLLLFGAGLYFLFPGEFRISYWVIVSILAFVGTLLALVLFSIVKSRATSPMTAAEGLKKQEGKVIDWDEAKGTGIVHVDGERWKARSKQPLKPGDIIRVVEVDGLVLEVTPVKSNAGTLTRLMTGRRAESA